MQVFKHRGVIHSQLILSPVAAGCSVQRPFHPHYACEVSNSAQRAPMSALKRTTDSSRTSRHVRKVPIPEVATPFDQREGVRLVLTLSSARVGKGGSNLRCDGW